MATLLAIVQDVADRIGLVRPSSVIGASDPQVRQLLAMCNQEGRTLARRYAWQAITKEQTFTSIAAEEQTSGIPADFDRMVKDTFYDRTADRPLFGPISAVEWADYKGGRSSITFFGFRIRGNSIFVAPTPQAGSTFAYEYVSKYWCGAADSDEAEQEAWAIDTDITYLDVETMTLGTMWRFQKSRGLDYAETFNEYEALLAQFMGRDGSARTLSMQEEVRFRRPRLSGVIAVPSDDALTDD